MTAILLATIGLLLMLCATLVVLLIGRDRAAAKTEAQITAVCDGLVDDLERERMKVRHLQERNAELRDELDLSQPCEASLTAEWLAFINRWPVLEDPR